MDDKPAERKRNPALRGGRASGLTPFISPQQLCPAHLSREAGAPRCTGPGRRESWCPVKTLGTGLQECTAALILRVGTAGPQEGWTEDRVASNPRQRRPTDPSPGQSAAHRGTPYWGCNDQQPANRAHCRAPSSTSKTVPLWTKGSVAALCTGDRNHGPWWHLNRAAVPPSKGGGGGCGAWGRGPHATCLVSPPPRLAAPARPSTWVLPGVRGGG